MTRAEYLLNSVKLFSISGIILFVANSFIYAGAYNESLLAYGTKITSYTFYIICVLCFLALNGEGVGYKRHRDFSCKKRINVLKVFLLFIFLVRFLKWAVEDVILEADLSGGALVCGKLFLGVFNTVSSFSFLFMLVSLTYLFRDVDTKRVFAVEAVSFIFGLVYCVYRTLSYAVTKYGLGEFGTIFSRIFSNEGALQIFSLVQYVAFIVMCFVVKDHYNSKVLGEQDEKIKERKRMLVAPKIYNTSHVGLDTLEDDYLLDNTEDESC